MYHNLGVAAKDRRRRRKMGKYIRGNVEESLPLTTLASRTLAQVAFDETVNERTLVSSLVAVWSIEDFTEGNDIGPIMVGIAHGDYSGAEIEAWIENTASWNEGDLVQREVANRKCRRVGVFDSDRTGDVLNNGRAIKTKLNWILNQGQTLRLWGYNLGLAAVATTVPNVSVDGHVNLWPR